MVFLAVLTSDVDLSARAKMGRPNLASPETDGQQLKKRSKLAISHLAIQVDQPKTRTTYTKIGLTRFSVPLHLRPHFTGSPSISFFHDALPKEIKKSY